MTPTWTACFKRTWLALPIFALAVLAATACWAQSLTRIVEVPNPPNAAEQGAKHYVVLVSLDGFRYDYAEKYGAKNLLAMAARGASAPDGMIPSYPSVTFPNHYTIVTGLYPEHHGIIGNSFYDPDRKETYSYTNPKATGDGSWYGGTPLWVLSEKQGLRAATFFWPGSNAEIQGKRPSYYADPYDDNFSDEKRVDQVLDWLRLPPEKRPHFITLYISIVDHNGHLYGPDDLHTIDSVHHVDEMIGKLADGIAAIKLPVDLVVLADHGMEKVQGDWVLLDKWADLSRFETIGPLLYPQSEADAEEAYRSLLGASGTFKVYRRAQVPADLHFDSNPREGDPVIVPTGPYLIVAHAPSASSAAKPPIGMHGYDPRQMPSMKAIFFAAGPDVRPGVKIAPFENVDVYPFIARMLGLSIASIDGDIHPLEGALAGNSKN